MEFRDFKNLIIDITTTSVGRNLIIKTYESFFQHAKFDGKFNFIITIDPTYNVTQEELKKTISYLDTLPDYYDQVIDIDYEIFDKNIGLERSLIVLLTKSYNRYCIHLEDDWEFFKDFDLNKMLIDIDETDATMIGFASTHLEQRATFELQNGVLEEQGTITPLRRLIPPNWACDYLPICPNIHDNYKWKSIYIKALMENYDPNRCPEERVKEYSRSKKLRNEFKVLWTKDILVKDIGKEWLAKKGLVKDILPDKKIESGWESPAVLVDKNNNLQLTRSIAFKERAEASIPGQTQTFMKRATNYLFNSYPSYVEKGNGSKVWDVDGNIYIDFISGLGVLSLGYNHPAINQAIISNIGRGVFHSLPTWLEIEAAEAIIDIVPNIEMVRFLKSGGDACSAALTLARQYTGKEKFITFGYHGWHDHFNPDQPGALSCLKENIINLDLTRFEKIKELDNYISTNSRDIACIFIALPYDNILKKEELNIIQNLCKKYNLLLILDEVVTGFRLALGGAQEYYNINSDIIILSKALAAGMPIAAIGGKKEIMQEMEKLHVSTTFGGEILSLACLCATIREYKTKDYIKHIWKLGEKLKNELNFIANDLSLKPIIRGYPCMPYIKFSENIEENQTLTGQFTAEMAKRGVLLRRDVSFINSSHSEEDVKYVVEQSKKVLPLLKIHK